MDLLPLFLTSAKLLGVSILAYIGYLVYILIILPYQKRKFYSKYNNVCMNPDFKPPMYDMSVLESLHDQNKYKWGIYLEYADKGKDIHITQFGYKTIFDLMSADAFDDFDKQIPEKIDKYTDLQELSFGKTFFGAVMHQPTNKSWHKRKTAFTKGIGLNFSSRYISLMLEHSKICMDKWNVGDKIDFIPEINNLTLGVIASILMGKDFNEKMKPINYTHLDGREEVIDFYTIFPRLGKDLMAAMQIPYNLLFPTLIRNNILHVNKVNYKNILAFRQALKDFLKASTDEESCYKQILKDNPDYDSEELFNDLQGFLFDGYETLSDTFCTTLYFLNKAPEAHKKIQEELKKLGFEQNEKLIESITYERLNELEYLMMVIKESLRIDPPLARSMHFYAKEKLSICGVPLEKDAIISMCFIARHYDPKQWHNPYKYIPERFDPESEYYFIPGEEKKAREARSYVPFSYAVRKCPAVTFAYLELKAVLTYYLSRFEYEVDQDLLDNESIRYGVLSHFPLNITIKKKYC